MIKIVPVRKILKILKKSKIWKKIFTNESNGHQELKIQKGRNYEFELKLGSSYLFVRGDVSR